MAEDALPKLGKTAQRCLDALVRAPLDGAACELAGQLARSASPPAQALAFARQLIRALPDSPWAYCLHAQACSTAGQAEAAIASCDAALRLQADCTEAFVRRGAARRKLGRHAQALADFTRAVALDPDRADAWAGLGRAFGKLQHYKLAIGAYHRALALAPDHPFLKARLLQQMILSCDWSELDPLIAEIADDVAAGKPSARPFVWQAVSASPRSLQRCAEIFTQAHSGNRVRARPSARPRGAGKLRIGYVSGELREHATSYLRVGVFEQHDPAAVELVAFDNGWDDGGPTRARINRAFGRIVSIGGLSDAQAAAQIAAARIDILVDCNGFNGLNRAGLFALRPAPLQVTFPGYPGTLGARQIDYIIADDTVIPPRDRRCYAEKIISLPGSYQANDDRRVIADRHFTRAELGLPADGIVFCCFNNNYKIMPPVFAAWVRILTAVEGSVLWLLADNPAAVANLRGEAARRGLDPARLVFAARMPVADHLARHRAADLFLDTLPCNAHATASDALWSGLPVLTCLGQTFSGRVAASLLHAVGLPELVTESLADYERVAIALASDPARLARLKQRLAQQRQTAPLFDTAGYTRHLEQAYRLIHQRLVAGQRPAHVAVVR